MKTAAVTNKNKPGRKPEHTEALAINEIWEREKLKDFKEGDEIPEACPIGYTLAQPGTRHNCAIHNESDYE